MDEIDDRPVDVTARRAVRIASLLGETEFAVELGLELKPSGGHPPSNRETTIRLMADPSAWGQPDGPAEQALSVYMHNRRVDDSADKDKFDSHGLGEIEDWLSMLTVGPELLENERRLEIRGRMVRIRERVRHKVFAALCAW